MARRGRKYELQILFPLVVRRCLKCDKAFDSYGDYLCEACNKENSEIRSGPARKRNKDGGRVVRKNIEGR